MKNYPPTPPPPMPDMELVSSLENGHHSTRWNCIPFAPFRRLYAPPAYQIEFMRIKIVWLARVTLWEQNGERITATNIKFVKRYTKKSLLKASRRAGALMLHPEAPKTPLIEVIR